MNSDILFSKTNVQSNKTTNASYSSLSENNFLTDEQQNEMEQYRSEFSKLKNKLRTRKIENANSSNRTPEKIQQFIVWAKSKGINDENVKIQNSSFGGLGLFARKPLKENELLLEIPSSIMLTVTNALNTRRLADFFKDSFIKSSPTLILVFYLLYQDNNPNCEWRPFFDILPCEYSSILSLPDDEMKLFEGSEIYTEIYNVQQIILVQYRYFKKRFVTDNLYNCQTLFGDVTLERFLLTYEAVWTRQNMIPYLEDESIENQKPLQIGAIIPFWDMANHKQGKPVSDYCLKKKALLFYSMNDTNAGEEVFNLYGDRTNVQLFITNGFVDLETSFLDPIKFTFNFQSDQNSVLKNELCMKLGIKPNQPVWLPLKTYVMPEKSTLFALMRIAVMKEKTLQYYIKNDASVLLQYNPTTPDIVELDIDANRWLKIRCAVLLRKFSKKKEKIYNPYILRLLIDEKIVLKSYAMELAPKE